MSRFRLRRSASPAQVRALPAIPASVKSSQINLEEGVFHNIIVPLERLAQVPHPLLLLPFAENCFKHGGPGKDGLFRVDVQLYADDQKLVFHIGNSKKNGLQNKHTGGLGLQNIRQRLLLLYPGRHQLNIDNLPDAYHVRLEIKFRDEKN